MVACDCLFTQAAFLPTFSRGLRRAAAPAAIFVRTHLRRLLRVRGLSLSTSTQQGDGGWPKCDKSTDRLCECGGKNPIIFADVICAWPLFPRAKPHATASELRCKTLAADNSSVSFYIPYANFANIASLFSLKVSFCSLSFPPLLKLSAPLQRRLLI